MYPSEYADYSFEQLGVIAVAVIIGGIVWVALSGGIHVTPTPAADPAKEPKPFPKVPAPPGELSLGEITAELSAIRELMDKISNFNLPDLVTPFERHINTSVNGYNSKVAKYVAEMQKCLEEARVLLEEERNRRMRG